MPWSELDLFVRSSGVPTPLADRGLTLVDHLLRNEGKVFDHDGVNAGDVRR